VTKPKIFYVLFEFPQISQTYIKNEIDLLSEQYEIYVAALKHPNIAYPTEQKHEYYKDRHHLLELIQDFQPDVLHTHWQHNVELVHWLSTKSKIPYTVRCHSNDVLRRPNRLRHLNTLGFKIRGKTSIKYFHPEQIARLIHRENCLGMLALPFSIPMLESFSYPSKKLIPCYPVLAYDEFHNEADNGHAIMNVGACAPKKKMEDFIDLAKLKPALTFNLYALGYDLEIIKTYNQTQGSPVDLIKPVLPEKMPAEYKRHRWLVYTACKDINMVGWPVAIAEAQAAGVGVCCQSVRPDIKDFIGESGIIFDDVKDIANLLEGPVPEEMRMLGFENAKKSDLKSHINLLTDLWN